MTKFVEAALEYPDNLEAATWRLFINLNTGNIGGRYV